MFLSAVGRSSFKNETVGTIGVIKKTPTREKTIPSAVSWNVLGRKRDCSFALEQCVSKNNFVGIGNHVASPGRWARRIRQQQLRLVREDVAPFTREKILGLHLRNFHWNFRSG